MGKCHTHWELEKWNKTRSFIFLSFIFYKIIFLLQMNYWYYLINLSFFFSLKSSSRDFSGDPVVLPFNAGDTGLIPDPARVHTP